MQPFKGTRQEVIHRQNLLFLLWDLHFQQSNPFLFPPRQWTQLVKRLNFVKVWGGDNATVTKSRGSKLKHNWLLVASCQLPVTGSLSTREAAYNTQLRRFCFESKQWVGFFSIRQENQSSQGESNHRRHQPKIIYPTTEASSFYKDQRSRHGMEDTCLGCSVSCRSSSCSVQPSLFFVETSFFALTIS